MRYKRLMIGLLILVMIVPILGSAYYSTTYRHQEYQSPSIDQDKVEKLSNETGVDQKRIIDWYNQSGDWNAVIAKAAEDKQEGRDLFQEEGMDYEGFSSEEVEEATRLVEMTLLKIDEIITLGENIESYKSLKERISTQDATHYTLKLRESLGDYNLGLDEYLLALQLELDLQGLLDDKENYEKQKEEKRLTYQEELITLSKIEEDLLDALSHMNTDSNTEGTVQDEENPIPIPHSADTKADTLIKPELPINPLDQLKEEIDAIKPSLD